VGYEKGDAYSAYLAMGGGALKTRAQVEYLREKAKPAHETYYAKADANGLLRITRPVCENQADLVKIK
jgi:beta-xylosidase